MRAALDKCRARWQDFRIIPTPTTMWAEKAVCAAVCISDVDSTGSEAREATCESNVSRFMKLLVSCCVESE